MCSPETFELSFLGGPLPEVLFDLDFEFLEFDVVMLIMAAGAPRLKMSELFFTTPCRSIPKLLEAAFWLPSELI